MTYTYINADGDTESYTIEEIDDAKSVRDERNTLLAETDWWALSDRTMTQAETDYRQALRDVPEQEGFPVNITSPTKP